MIRRLFWLLLGAVLGVAAYRRVTTLARAVSPGARAAGLTRFAADVREGMELYLERHPRPAASTLETHTGHAQLPPARTGRARYPGDDAKDGR